MKVALNGAVVDAREAVISVYDHGFLYGIGLFETFRTYGGKPYLLSCHLQRMRSGCQQLGIPFTISEQDVEASVHQLLAANQLQDGYVRLTVSAGEGELGLPVDDYQHPTILLLVKSLPGANSGAALAEGRELRLLATKRNTPEGQIRFKSLHYMNNIIAKRELEAFKRQDALLPSKPVPVHGVEGLMLTEEGYLAEGIVSNLFFAKDEVLYTPSIETGILPGITRQRVLELASEAGINCVEGLFQWRELIEADEVWLTNSIQEIVPVTLLTDTAGQSFKVGEGCIGYITKQLLGAYQADTRKNIDIHE